MDDTGKLIIAFLIALILIIGIVSIAELKSEELEYKNIANYKCIGGYKFVVNKDNISTSIVQIKDENDKNVSCNIDIGSGGIKNGSM